MKYGPEQLAADLRRLLSLPLRTKRELAAWLVAGREVEERIFSNSVVASQVPESVWHYLGDADIRSKDAAYKLAQEEQLLAVLAGLASGKYT